MKNLESKFLEPFERSNLLKAYKKQRDGRIKDRIKVILLLDQGWDYKKIAEALFLDDQTLRNYTDRYDQGKLEALTKFECAGCPFKLNESEFIELQQHLEDITYLTSTQIKEHIKAKYNKDYTIKGSISLLHHIKLEQCLLCQVASLSL